MQRETIPQKNSLNVSQLRSLAKTVSTSLLDLPFEDEFFDATVSLHTIYHIHKDDQEKAVRQLLRVSKKGVPVIIIYSNPDKLLTRIKRNFRNPFQKSEPYKSNSDLLYFHAHPLEWWRKFEDTASVELHPWRFFTASDAHRLVPSNKVGSAILKGFLKLDELAPKLMTSWGAYPIIILRKGLNSKIVNRQ